MKTQCNDFTDLYVNDKLVWSGLTQKSPKCMAIVTALKSAGLVAKEFDYCDGGQYHHEIHIVNNRPAEVREDR